MPPNPESIEMIIVDTARKRHPDERAIAEPCADVTYLCPYGCTMFEAVLGAHVANAFAATEGR